MLVAGLLAVVLAPGPAPAARPVSYARDVLPLLSEYCYHCHGPDEKSRKADLRLDAAADVLRKDGPLVVPGKSAESELIRRLLTDDASEVMPPPRSKKPLPPAAVATLKAWVDQGAKWGTHWAFTPPARPTPPDAGHPIDAFVRARLKAEGLDFRPEADPRTLVRRVTLDLTGLPPTPAEVDAYVRSALRDPQSAFPELVDRLLTSPRFGERMAWDWLDASRYADTNGYQGDNERTAWPWRDWVVRAYNQDLPYDRFATLQLAGDLVPGATDDDRLATAFLRNHPVNGEGGRIAEENRADYVMDMAETTGTVFLGLTFNCCRCHDHKFDPLKQSEYYGLFAFFNRTPVTGAGGNPFTEPTLRVPTAAQDAAVADAEARLRAAAARVLEQETPFPKSASARWPGKLKDSLKDAPAARSDEAVAALLAYFDDDRDYRSALEALRDAKAARDDARRAVPRVMVMADTGPKRDTFILEKGLYNKPGAKVPAVVPAALGPGLPAGVPADRLALARWLFAPDNPLAARVAVNRAWQQLFGVGLVKTSEDFGVQGERPTHPELLDWLAVEFQKPADGSAKAWSTKRLVKLIVTSRTYRQSSAAPVALFERDPQNRLLARGPRFRLPAWAIRDQALAASGLLTPTVGGPSVNPYQPAGVWEEATFGTKKYTPDTGAALYRRSLYTFWRRIAAPTAFFDSATRTTCSVKPARTNTPLHALATLNDPTHVEAARTLGQRAIHAAKDDASRVSFAVSAVLARPPTAEESRVLLAALTRLRGQYAADPAAAAKLLAVGESKRDPSIPVAEHAAMAALCGVVLNLDEALTKE